MIITGKNIAKERGCSDKNQTDNFDFDIILLEPQHVLFFKGAYFGIS